jgi:hypothetical protein
LQDAGFELTGFFYNPNIHPLTEYVQRRDALREAEKKLGIKVIYKDEEYDPSVYLRAVSHRESNRCFHCYQMRLERTSQIAKRGNFDAFSSTLLYSKKQQHEAIAGLGRDIAAGGKCSFHYEDWREGWSEGIETSKDWGMYRQQYCGCIYSEAERFAKLLKG